jgi:hypothetical protein
VCGRRLSLNVAEPPTGASTDIASCNRCNRLLATLDYHAPVGIVVISTGAAGATGVLCTGTARPRMNTTIGVPSQSQRQSQHQKQNQRQPLQYLYGAWVIPRRPRRPQNGAGRHGYMVTWLQVVDQRHALARAPYAATTTTILPSVHGSAIGSPTCSSHKNHLHTASRTVLCSRAHCPQSPAHCRPRPRAAGSVGCDMVCAAAP